MKITYLFRARTSNFHSIEQAFSAIFPAIDRSFERELIRLPEPGAGPGAVRRNLRFLRKQQLKGASAGKAKKTTSRKTVCHITGHVNYVALATGRQSVLTVHDIRSALVGPLPVRLIRLIFWFWIPCWIVRRISVISEFTKGELKRLVPFAARKAMVIPNPVLPLFKAHPLPAGKPVQRVLVVGTKANKNLERIVPALEGLGLELCIIGKLADAHIRALEAAKINYSNKHTLPNEELLQCYRDADLLCFPSLYEGFGMPIIEAQAVGRPVLSSDRGAMKEVARDSACLVDPESTASIREGIRRIMEDADYRAQLVAKGFENIKRFGAEKIGEAYIGLYREVLGAGGEK